MARSDRPATVATVTSDRRAAVALVVAAGILVGSVLPVGGGVGTPVFGFDKWVHAAEFALLAFTVARALRPDRTRRRALSLTVALALGFGLGIELLQTPIPWRSGSAVDFAADTVGVAVATAFEAARGRRRS